MARYARLAFAVACAVLSVAALSNVFADNEDVLAQAKQVGCIGDTCALAQMERTPFAQTFELRGPKAGSVVIRCARAGVFFGAYTCTKQ